MQRQRLPDDAGQNVDAKVRPEGTGGRVGGRLGPDAVLSRDLTSRGPQLRR